MSTKLKKPEKEIPQNNNVAPAQVEPVIPDVPKVSTSQKIKKPRKLEKNKEESGESSSDEEKDSKTERKSKSKSKKSKGKKRAAPTEDSKKAQKKLFRPKKLKNSEWLDQALIHAVNENEEIIYPQINAVKYGDFKGFPYLNIGEYDFHYDCWTLQLKFKHKDKTSSKPERWVPKDAHQKYFVKNKKLINDIAFKLIEVAEQSDSEVELIESEESDKE